MTTAGGALGRRWFRRLALLLALVIMLAILLWQGSDTYLSGYGSVGSDDFIQYWSAVRLLVRGEDPYDPVALFAVEREAGLDRAEPIRMWNPPWTLALVLPLALLPFWLAIPLWLLLQLGICLGAGMLLWAFYAAETRRPWIGAALAAGFVSCWYGLWAGQLSPWLLFGVAGFLYCQRRGGDWLAGGALALLMIKPHVAYLFWLSALWWALRQKRWRVLGGWLATLAGASVIALAFAPDVWANYLAAAAAPPLDWATPTLGGWLRYLLGIERRWLQFLPTLVSGLVWLVWLWRRRGSWRWKALAAPLLLASVPTAAYGWSYDGMVLLPAAVDLVSQARLVARRCRLLVLGALGMLQAALVVQNWLEPNDLYKVWFPLALAGVYCWGVGSMRAREVLAKEGIEHG